jgi:hypothetical protein
MRAAFATLAQGMSFGTANVWNFYAEGSGLGRMSKFQVLICDRSYRTTFNKEL